MGKEREMEGEVGKSNPGEKKTSLPHARIKVMKRPGWGYIILGLLLLVAAGLVKLDPWHLFNRLDPGQGASRLGPGASQPLYELRVHNNRWSIFDRNGQVLILETPLPQDRGEGLSAGLRSYSWAELRALLRKQIMAFKQEGGRVDSSWLNEQRRKTPQGQTPLITDQDIEIMRGGGVRPAAPAPVAPALAPAPALQEQEPRPEPQSAPPPLTTAPVSPAAPLAPAPVEVPPSLASRSSLTVTWLLENPPGSPQFEAQARAFCQDLPRYLNGGLTDRHNLASRVPESQQKKVRAGRLLDKQGKPTPLGRTLFVQFLALLRNPSVNLDGLVGLKAANALSVALIKESSGRQSNAQLNQRLCLCLAKLGTRWVDAQVRNRLGCQDGQ